MTSHHPHAVMHLYPLINAKRQYGGMRIVIDNRAVDEKDVRAALNLVSESEAAAKHPLIVAFSDAHLPTALAAWEPPANTAPEFQAEWLKLPAAREMLGGGNFSLWCLNDASGVVPDPALTANLLFSVTATVPGQAVAPLPKVGKARIRTGARNHAEADAMFAKGNEWVAGWPLEAGVAKSDNRHGGNRAIIMRLLQLAQADADVSDLEALLKQDAALSFKLLRFINSPANGLSVQVQSFQHAVMILGYKKLVRWLSLLLLASSDDPNLLPLMGISLRRGFFMQHIGKSLFDDANPDELFITGMFSLLNLIFSQPFEVLLEQLHLPEAVSDSLLNHGEPFGSLLRLAEAIEGDDAEAIRDAAQMLGLNEADVNRALLQAIADTDQVELH